MDLPNAGIEPWSPSLQAGSLPVEPPEKPIVVLQCCVNFYCIAKCMTEWSYIYIHCFPGGSDGKDSTGSAGDPVQSLSQEDPLEKGMATHSNILAWRIP